MRILRGDTLVEVIFAIAVFSFVSVLTIVVMSNSVETAQANLEITMARTEIDSQSEIIRFIHNSFLSEREYTSSEQVYRELWKRLTDDKTAGGLSNSFSVAPSLNYNTCAEAYDNSKSNSINNVHGFIMNTRLVDPSKPENTIVSYNPNTFTQATLYPRVIYTENGSEEGDILSTGQIYRSIARAEGIWIVSIRSQNETYPGKPDYYDFHIRTCWYAPGSDIPSTIGTIIRLYNPELIVEVKRRQ